MDLWPACRETIHIGPLGGDMLRMVESQQQIATTSLVDDLAEQTLLEELIEQHTQFRAHWRSERGVRLQAPPCAAYESELRHPSDYGACQRLGRALRESGVGAFEFGSARDPDRGINVALLGPEALTSRTPIGIRAWLCETRPDRILFVSGDEPELHVLAFDLFTSDRVLPAG